MDVTGNQGMEGMGGEEAVVTGCPGEWSPFIWMGKEEEEAVVCVGSEWSSFNFLGDSGSWSSVNCLSFSSGGPFSLLFQ